jgi:antitoxin (DNA-binding transcriptional repressor) of toxin-antitoxin stability system
MRNHIKPGRRSRQPATRAVGVRELKTHAARILRHVREARASYILTHRGQAVGVILPLDAPAEMPRPADVADAGTAWNAFLSAGQRIEARFRPGAGGVGLLSEMRR